MRKILWIAGAALALTGTQAQAFDRDRDRGWGARYNSHLSAWDGTPLGPPLSALPPGYQYYNGRLIGPVYSPYPRIHVYAPPVVRTKRLTTKRAASRHR